MPLLFYGYKVLIKRDLFVLNIIIFYIVIVSSQYLFFLILRLDELPYILQYLGCAGTFILFGGYMIHTLMPAKSFIFEDPINHKYGYKGHTETYSIKKKK